LNDTTGDSAPACEIPAARFEQGCVKFEVGETMSFSNKDATHDVGEHVELACRLIAAFENVKNEDTRTALLALVESMANTGRKAGQLPN
jgi:hypothetical protein